MEKELLNCREAALGLLEFISESPSPFHAAASIEKRLRQAGFVLLPEYERWNLERGGKYYVMRGGSSIAAFLIPETEEEIRGFQMICSHTDSPAFKIKESFELKGDPYYRKLNVEKYGGMICSSWFDRPLSVAGRVMVFQEGRIVSKLVHIDRDLLMIPNLAIHMNREINDGFRYQIQQDLCPVLGEAGEKGGFLELLAEAAQVPEEEILGTDLYLYNRQKGTFWGQEQEFIASPRLDDLQCVYGSLMGFLKAVPGRHVPVFCAFNNEETGSLSRQGAASTFLQDLLKRISRSLGGDEEDYIRRVANSFMLSADNAHAVHPNHPEKADPVNRPVMNGGIVIKYQAEQKYTTDARGGAVVKLLCRKAGVPWQVYTNHSNQPGGSTLGNLSNMQVSQSSADIGLAQLAMHSAYEMAGAEDVYHLQRLAEVFYNTDLNTEEDESVILA